jgi:protein O-GlcNAc transferase
MKKIISFCLWGNNPTYNIGAIRNAEDALTLYPDFECWFYIDKNTVPCETIDKLRLLSNTKIILKDEDITNEYSTPMMWRFEPIDDPEVEIMMARDTDTRFTQREKLAVNEWLSSNKTFHIMRDHPHHNFCILGGMFGTKKIPELSNWMNSMNLYKKHSPRDYDQYFLRDYIYPLIKEDCVVHASFHQKEHHAKPFPINYCNEYRFVGEYVYADESRSNYHIDELKRFL